MGGKKRTFGALSALLFALSLASPALSIYWIPNLIVVGGPSLTEGTDTFGPPLSIDGDTRTYWGGSASVETWTLLYDLRATRTIGVVEADFRDSRSVPPLCTLEISPDASNWGEIARRTGDTSLTWHVDAHREGRYLRLRMSGRALVDFDLPRITEFRVSEIPPDTTPPEILHTPPPTPVFAGDDGLSIAAIVTDTSGVAWVSLGFLGPTLAWETIPMTPIVANGFIVTVPREAIRAPEFLYFISAADSAGNRGGLGSPETPLRLDVVSASGILTADGRLVANYDPDSKVLYVPDPVDPSHWVAYDLADLDAGSFVADSAGHVLFVSSDGQETSVWYVDPAFPEAVPVVTGEWSDLFPAFSPDGKYLLFASNRGGTFDLYMQEIDSDGDGRPDAGGVPIRLTGYGDGAPLDRGVRIGVAISRPAGVEPLDGRTLDVWGSAFATAASDSLSLLPVDRWEVRAGPGLSPADGALALLAAENLPTITFDRRLARWTTPANPTPGWYTLRLRAWYGADFSVARDVLWYIAPETTTWGLHWNGAGWVPAVAGGAEDRPPGEGWQFLGGDFGVWIGPQVVPTNLPAPVDLNVEYDVLGDVFLPADSASVRGRVTQDGIPLRGIFVWHFGDFFFPYRFVVTRNERTNGGRCILICGRLEFQQGLMTDTEGRFSQTVSAVSIKGGSYRGAAGVGYVGASWTDPNTRWFPKVNGYPPDYETWAWAGLAIDTFEVEPGEVVLDPGVPCAQGGPATARILFRSERTRVPLANRRVALLLRTDSYIEVPPPHPDRPAETTRVALSHDLYSMYGFGPTIGATLPRIAADSAVLVDVALTDERGEASIDYVAPWNEPVRIAADGFGFRPDRGIPGVADWWTMESLRIFDEHWLDRAAEAEREVRLDLPKPRIDLTVSKTRVAPLEENEGGLRLSCAGGPGMDRMVVQNEGVGYEVYQGKFYGWDVTFDTIGLPTAIARFETTVLVPYSRGNPIQVGLRYQGDEFRVDAILSDTRTDADGRARYRFRTPADAPETFWVVLRYAGLEVAETVTIVPPPRARITATPLGCGRYIVDGRSTESHPKSPAVSWRWLLNDQPVAEGETAEILVAWDRRGDLALVVADTAGRSSRAETVFAPAEQTETCGWYSWTWTPPLAGSPAAGGAPRVAVPAASAGPAIRFPSSSGGGWVEGFPCGGGTPVVNVIDGNSPDRPPSHELYPTFSPDGRWISFSSDTGGEMNVYVMEFATRRIFPVVMDAGADLYPAWSPDGRELAFASDRAGSFDLYRVVVDSDGDGFPDTGGIDRRITDAPGLEMKPTWSPDGTEIAFHADAAGSPDIYRAPSVGGPWTRLTTGPARDENPAWSPDGRWILFHTDRIGTVDPSGSAVVRNFDLWAVDLAENREVPVTNEPVDEMYPAWSFDGCRVAYVSFGGGGRGDILVFHWPYGPCGADTAAAPVLISPVARMVLPCAVTGETLVLDGSGSTDDGRVIAWGWDLGDGRAASGREAGVVYAETGTYEIRLLVRDDQGLWGFETGVIVVREGARAVLAGPETGVTGEVLRYDASASRGTDGAPPAAIRWFVDGRPVTPPTDPMSLDFTTFSPGTHRIAVEIEGACGEIRRAERIVRVYLNIRFRINPMACTDPAPSMAFVYGIYNYSYDVLYGDWDWYVDGVLQPDEGWRSTPRFLLSRDVPHTIRAVLKIGGTVVADTQGIFLLPNRPLPDLTVSTPWWTDPPRVGDSFTLYTRVSNVGSDAAENIDVVLAWGKWGLFQSWEEYLNGTVWIDRLAPGESRIVSWSYLVRPEDRIYANFKAIVDPLPDTTDPTRWWNPNEGGVIEECNEFNNMGWICQHLTVNTEVRKTDTAVEIPVGNPCPETALILVEIDPATIPSGWSAYLDRTSFELAPGEIREILLTVTSTEADLADADIVVRGTSPCGETGEVHVRFELRSAPWCRATGGTVPCADMSVLLSARAGDTDGTIVSFDWDLGDGSRVSGETVLHDYPAPGTYTAVVVARDNEGLTSADTLVVVVPGPVHPTARLAGPDETGLAGGSFRFEASATPADVTYAWRIDGAARSETGTVLVLSNLAAGTHLIEVTVSTSCGETASAERRLVLRDAAPLRVSIDPVPCSTAGETIPLSGRAETDSQARIISWAWDFADGAGETGGSAALHRYAAPGTYRLALEVHDSLDRTARAEETLSVAPRLTVLLGGPARGLVGETLVFTDSGNAHSRAWFIDGAKGANADPRSLAVAFAAPGLHRVEVRAEGACGRRETAAQEIRIWPELLPPSVVLAATPGLCPADPARLAAEASDTDGEVVRYEWDPGDGTRLSIDSTVAHVYPSPGTYTVTVTVFDDDGLSDSASVLIVVPDSVRPVLSLDGPDTALVDEMILVTAALSPSPNGPVAYRWRLDGAPLRHTTATVGYIFRGPAAHLFEVSVTTACGETAAAEKRVAIRALAPPVASIEIRPGTCPQGPVFFSGAASRDPDGDSLAYLWDFGDGETAAFISGSHAYATPGTYLVRLLVTDADGLTDETEAGLVLFAASAGLTVEALRLDGPDTLPLYTRGVWALRIVVSNPGTAPAEAVRVTDIFPGEFEILGVTPARGSVETTLSGASTHIEWSGFDLAPGETAALDLLLATRTNGAGQQEFTTSGRYPLDEGARAQASSPCGAGLSAGPADFGVVAASENPEAGGRWERDESDPSRIRFVSTSTDTDGWIVRTAWRIDTAAYSGETVEVRFDRPARHTAVVQVTDNDGLTDSAALEVAVADLAFARGETLQSPSGTGIPSGAAHGDSPVPPTNAPVPGAVSASETGPAPQMQVPGAEPSSETAPPSLPLPSAPSETATPATQEETDAITETAQIAPPAAVIDTPPGPAAGETSVPADADSIPSAPADANPEAPAPVGTPDTNAPAETESNPSAGTPAEAAPHETSETQPIPPDSHSAAPETQTSEGPEQRHDAPETQPSEAPRPGWRARLTVEEGPERGTIRLYREESGTYRRLREIEWRRGEPASIEPTETGAMILRVSAPGHLPARVRIEIDTGEIGLSPVRLAPADGLRLAFGDGNAGEAAHLATGDSSAEVRVPRGALGQDYEILIREVSAETLAVSNRRTRFGGASVALPEGPRSAREFLLRNAATGAEIHDGFGGPLTISLTYDPAAARTAGIDEATLAIHFLDPATGEWAPVATSRREAPGRLSAEVTHFSIYGILGTAVQAQGTAEMRVYPNPYDARRHSFGFVTFDQLGAGAEVAIYTVTGEEVRRLTGGPAIQWDLRNRNGSPVASGRYVYRVRDASGGTRVGQIGVIR